MIQILTEIQASGNVSLNFNIQKGFEVSVNSRIFGDIPKAIGSFAIMFCYVAFNLGKLKLDDNRYYLSQVKAYPIFLFLHKHRLSFWTPGSEPTL